MKSGLVATQDRWKWHHFNT